MISRVYDKTKKIMKDNKMIILIYIILVISFSIPLPYYIDKPGGAINIRDKVKINEAHSSTGGFYYGYVSEMRATLPFYLYARFNPDWDLIKSKDMTYDNETIKDENVRNKILMNETNSNAVIVAYQKANKKIEVTKEKLFVTYIDENADTNLNIGDQIIEINGKTMNSKQEIYDIIRNSSVNDKIEFKVLSNKKEQMKYGKIKQEDGISMVGVMISFIKEYKTEPKIEILTSSNESGPSGGLMLSLTIYDMLTEKDLTKGYKIVGTGTMEEDGTVGEIGGVEFKLKGAVKENADIFLVPSGDNYKDAIKIKKEKKYKIKIKAISTFEEAIDFLQHLY